MTTGQLTGSLRRANEQSSTKDTGTNRDNGRTKTEPILSRSGEIVGTKHANPEKGF